MPFFAEGQKRFDLVNPSFDADLAGPNKTPEGWLNLGLESYTPPDILPGAYGVTIQAQHGPNFLGLVTRDDNSWEGVGQKLDGWLKKDSCYAFSIWVARSNTYLSGTRAGKQANFTAPTILKIWGFNTKDQTDELLAESTPVSHSKWVKYSFVLKPKNADYNEIDLMAYYAPGHEVKNGNLLLDSCSAIEQIWPADAKSGLIKTENLQKVARAQIELDNPSFERLMRLDVSDPLGWYTHRKCTDCEIVIEPGQYFESRDAAEGRTFIVLRTDDMGKGNLISQTLEEPLEKGKQYAFSVYLSKAAGYVGTRLNRKDTEWSNKRKFNGSLVFYVWGYNDETEDMELLASTGLIEHSEWKQYAFKLKPVHDSYTHIALEGWYNPKAKNFYHGHILVDNCSTIERLED